MSRAKKDQKVETIRHRSGLMVDVFFNPNSVGEFGLTFSAKVGDRWFRNADAHRLKREVCDYLSANLELTWHPVIIVSEVAPFSPGRASFVGIEVERAYLAQGADGRVRQLNWDDYEVTPGEFGPSSGESVDSFRLSRATQSWGGLKRVPDDLPYVTKHSDKETRILPYTEELYAGLVEIDGGIDKLKLRLRTLLAGKDGWTQIAAIGARITKLLPENV